MHIVNPSLVKCPVCGGGISIFRMKESVVCQKCGRKLGTNSSIATVVAIILGLLAGLFIFPVIAVFLHLGEGDASDFQSGVSVTGGVAALVIYRLVLKVQINESE